MNGERGDNRRTTVRVPPQDLDAEKSVLGCCMLSADAYDVVVQHIKTECFFGDANRRIFACLAGMREQGGREIDVITLANTLVKRGDLDEIGGTAYLAELMETVPHAAHADYYAKIVKEKWLNRLLVETAEKTIQEVFAGSYDAEDLMVRAERRVFSVLEQQQVTETVSIREILEETFERIYERMEKGEGITGTPSGLASLDDLTSGFQPTELVILAARPSMGKTALICNVALNAALLGKGVLIFSLEQSRVELAERLLCVSAIVSGRRLRRGILDGVEQTSLMTASTQLKDLPIFVDDQVGVTVPRIGAICRRVKRRAPLGLVMIDYLQLIESEDRGKTTREQQVAGITRRLKFLAKELEVPVIALAQLNRAVETREDKRPRLSDLRESGSIEQDADVVMFLHRPEAYDPNNRPGEVDLIIAKNRSGPIGAVELAWVKEMMYFADKTAIVSDCF